MKTSLSPQPFVPAMPVTIIATKSADGALNFAPHGMVGQLSQTPPLMYVSVIKTHKTAKNIEETGRFSINYPSADALEALKACGAKSGDKQKAFEVFYGADENTPLVAACPAGVSCKLHSTIDTADITIFIGEVVEIIADDSCVIDGVPQAELIKPMLCALNGKFYAFGDIIG